MVAMTAVEPYSKPECKQRLLDLIRPISIVHGMASLTDHTHSLSQDDSKKLFLYHPVLSLQESHAIALKTDTRALYEADRSRHRMHYIIILCLWRSIEVVEFLRQRLNWGCGLVFRIAYLVTVFLLLDREMEYERWEDEYTRRDRGDL